MAAEGAGDSPQEKTVAQLQAEEHLSKKRRRSASSTKVSPPIKKKGKRGSHYLEDRLGKSKREILGLMPRAIADRIHDCVWVKCGRMGRIIRALFSDHLTFLAKWRREKKLAK